MIMSMFTGLELTSFAEDDILNFLTYEINDNKITAMAARTILRKAAGLE